MLVRAFSTHTVPVCACKYTLFATRLASRIFRALRHATVERYIQALLYSGTRTVFSENRGELRGRLRNDDTTPADLTARPEVLNLAAAASSCCLPPAKEAGHGCCCCQVLMHFPD